MAVNKNWARWVFSSLASYLKGVADAESIPAIVEGVHTREDKIINATEHVEIAITGPYSREITKGYYQLKVGVRVLIHSRMGSDRKNDNRYGPQRIAGIFHEALDGVIAIHKIGKTPAEDDQTLLGCLSLLNGQGDAIRVMHFGQTSPTESLRQSMVDCWYLMELQTEE